jgi:hypothetical protein
MGILASNVEHKAALGRVSQQAMVKLVEYTSSMLGTCMHLAEMDSVSTKYCARGCEASGG